MSQRDLYEAVPKHRTTDSVVASIQSLIIQRKLQPGDALPPERELAAMLSVSRNVLREAFGILGQRGLISSRPGSGTFVSLPSGNQARDALKLLLEIERVGLVQLCDARLLIEPELASLAARGVTAENAAALKQTFEALGAASADGEAHVRADLAFHSAIADMANHAVLRAIVEAVREPVTRGMIFGTSVPRAIDHSDAQHEAIMNAILDQDPIRARQEMTNHLTYVRDYLLIHDVKVARWASGDVAVGSE